MTRSEAQQFFDRRTDAWRRRDVEALVRAHTEYCVLESGTNSGGFMGMAPTGKRFSFAAVLICTMRDGLIAHEQRIYDFTGFLLEIGVLKARPN
jgi:hypothetical protein